MMFVHKKVMALLLFQGSKLLNVLEFVFLECFLTSELFLGSSGTVKIHLHPSRFFANFLSVPIHPGTL